MMKHGPPKTEEPSELWRKITTMPRPHEVVDFPRLDESGEPVARLAMWVLTQEEQSNAAAEALRTTRKKLLEQADSKALPGEDGEAFRNVYDNVAACEILHRACRQADDLSRPFFPSSNEMRKHLSVDEVGVLVSCYYEVQSKLGPIVSMMTEDEYHAWVEKLSEGAAVFPLGRLSSQARTELTMRLASDLWKCWTANSSPTSPPESGETETSQAESE